MKNLVSIIIPLFNEVDNFADLLGQLREVLGGMGRPYEIIFIDDGSTDGTFKLIQREAKEDSRIYGIYFRRNYGQTAALMAGIHHASGDICITMDGDLQHNPEQIPEFIAKIDEGYDLVCSYRYMRNDALIRRIPSKVANYMARKFARLNIRDFGSTYRAYRTSVIKELPIYGEMHRFVPVFVNMVTNRITELPIQLRPRKCGLSSYGIGRTFRVLSDLILLLFFAGFFNRPIHIFGYISILLGLPGVAILFSLTMGKIFGQIVIMDYGPIFILGVILCLVAVQLFTTGIVCEYLIRIYYNDTRRTPYSIGETTREPPVQDS